MKKGLKIAKIALTSLFVIFIIYTWISVINAKSKNQPPQVFGYSLFVVETPSMEDYIKVDDLVIVKVNNIKDIKENDVISFKSIDETSQIYGRYITHRVIKIEELDGKIFLTTKGDNNATEDRLKVSEANYYGKVVCVSSFLGSIMTFLTNGYTFIFLIIFVFLAIFIIYQIRFIVKTLKEEKQRKELERLKEELENKRDLE